MTVDNYEKARANIQSERHRQTDMTGDQAELALKETQAQQAADKILSQFAGRPDDLERMIASLAQQVLENRSGKQAITNGD
jgi:hypothetical protein